MRDESGLHLTPSSSSIVALTGATGFIGQYVAAALIARGWRVRALVRTGHRGVARVRPKAAPGEPDLPTLAPPGALRLPGLQAIPGSLEDPSSLRELVRGCDGVVHLAGAIRGRSYADFAMVNVSGTERLLDACLHQAPHARLIHVSSLAAREPDLSWYARSKYAGERLVINSGLAYSGLRPPAVYGPEDPAMAPVWRSLARGWLWRVAPATARFSLLHARDLAEAVCRLLEAPAASTGMLEIDDGRPDGYDFPALAAIATRRRGRPVRVIPVPAPLLRAAAGINLGTARLSGRKPMLTPAKLRELTHPDWTCDNTALEQHLGWAPSTRLEHCLDTLPGFGKPKDER